MEPFFCDYCGRYSGPFASNNHIDCVTTQALEYNRTLKFQPNRKIVQDKKNEVETQIEIKGPIRADDLRDLTKDLTKHSKFLRSLEEFKILSKLDNKKNLKEMG